MLKTLTDCHWNGSSYAAAASANTQKVMIVNGSFSTLELIETVLQAGHYDVVFVESNEQAYSQVRLVRPDLVILCVRFDQMDGFHVLSMLKLDSDTRDIPVLTYAVTRGGRDFDEDATEPIETEMFPSRPVVLMN
jgi:PleD family two-component response regulator